MFDGIGREFVHDETESLRDSATQHYVGPHSLDPVGKAPEFKPNDFAQGAAFKGARHQHRLTARQRQYALRQHFANLLLDFVAVRSRLIIFCKLRQQLIFVVRIDLGGLDLHGRPEFIVDVTLHVNLAAQQP